MMPAEFTATLTGVKKRAFVPTALLSPLYAKPRPASVVTTPPGETARITWFAVSATYTVPSVLKATPCGP
jgi:hypothetical protein